MISYDQILYTIIKKKKIITYYVIIVDKVFFLLFKTVWSDLKFYILEIKRDVYKFDLAICLFYVCIEI